MTWFGCFSHCIIKPLFENASKVLKTHYTNKPSRKCLRDITHYLASKCKAQLNKKSNETKCNFFANFTIKSSKIGIST